MSFRPLGNAVLVKLHPDPPRKVGSLFLPDNAHRENADYQKATVVAVGTGRGIAQVYCPDCNELLTCPKCGHEPPTRRTIDLKPGDVVLLERGLERSGFLEMHTIEGEKVWMLPEEHIQLKVEPEP